MADNAAKQYNSQEWQQAVEQPRVAPSPQVAPNQAPLKVSWSRFEKILVTACGLVLTFMMVTLVSTKITLTNNQHQLQNVNTKITKISNKNSSAKQVISELTSQSHLEKVAKKHGLTLSNNNIRNVNK
jgi:cell division protein FtsL